MPCAKLHLLLQYSALVLLLLHAGTGSADTFTSSPGPCSGGKCSNAGGDGKMASLEVPELNTEEILENLLQWVEKNFNVTGLKGPNAPFKIVISGDNAVVRNPDEPKEKARPSFGLAAAQDLKSGEIVFNFPPEMIVRGDTLLALSKDPARPDHPELFLSAQEDNLGWGQFLAVAAFLLREKAKGADSFWAPFLAVLPEHVGLPLFWGDELIAALEYEPAVGLIKGYKEAFQSNWEKMNPEAIANASKSEFYWALSIAVSRVFGVSKPTYIYGTYSEPGLLEKWDDGKETGVEAGGGSTSSGASSSNSTADDGTGTVLALCPVADFLNHATAYSIEWIVDHKIKGVKGSLKYGSSSTVPVLDRIIAMRFGTLQDVPAGTEVTITYGNRNNDHLLQCYGFVMLPNKYDDVLLATGPSQVIELFARVQKRREEKQVNKTKAAKSKAAAAPLPGSSDDEGELDRQVLAQFPQKNAWEALQLAPEVVLIKCNRAVQQQKAAHQGWYWLAEPKHLAVDVVEVPEGKEEDEDLQPRYAVWGGGDIDPRLLVAFAAFRFIETHRKEPSYMTLAQGAIPFGWSIMEASCLQNALKATEEEALALQEAAADLKVALELTQASFSTKYEEDELALQELHTCRKMGFKASEEGKKVAMAESETDWSSVCSATLEQSQREWELVLLFLMVKKIILREGMRKLEERCIHPVGEKAFEGVNAQASMLGAGLMTLFMTSLAYVFVLKPAIVRNYMKKE